MTENDIRFLKSKVDKEPVKITFSDGEAIIAKILSVSEDEQDIIYDVVSTNREDKYINKNGAYLATFDRIVSVS